LKASAQPAATTISRLTGAIRKWRFTSCPPFCPVPGFRVFL
jgi:hypothetical protein